MPQHFSNCSQKLPADEVHDRLVLLGSVYNPSPAVSSFSPSHVLPPHSPLPHLLLCKRLGSWGGKQSPTSSAQPPHSGHIGEARAKP